VEHDIQNRTKSSEEEQQSPLQETVRKACTSFSSFLPARYQPVLTNNTFLTGLARYLELLAQENEHINLTADAAPEHVLTTHVRDSLAPLLTDFDPPASLLDIGTGGGFPAVPLALAWPHTTITMVESIGKKARFLERLCREIPLPNACVVHGRVEDPVSAVPHHSFQMITARGIAHIAVVFHYALSLLTHDGQLLLWKGRRDLLELQDPSFATILQQTNCAATVLDYSLPGVERDSKLVILQHIRSVNSSLPERRNQ